MTKVAKKRQKASDVANVVGFLSNVRGSRLICHDEILEGDESWIFTKKLEKAYQESIVLTKTKTTNTSTDTSQTTNQPLRS